MGPSRTLGKGGAAFSRVNQASVISAASLNALTLATPGAVTSTTITQGVNQPLFVHPVAE